MKIVFATNNNNKLKEIKSIFKKMNLNSFSILSLKDLGLDNLYIEENEETIEGNAELKASIISDLSGLPSFADDTGLEIDALDGKPGVHSSRFAGEESNDAENRKLVLKLLENVPDDKRTARFKTVIAFVDKKQSYLFEGLCYGRIIKEERGNNGFGYDSIFIPDGFDITFAEMEPDLKNQISHRSIAFGKFVNFLS
ncbi:MAG: RdgB/HAM1 family non-canonical purine NTP pyrophosphatase [Candidatus Kapabacteria bacterium]|nr:RdgB/HAM1 family non-canonical purine NTP pyrophosphatase [Candidatus Kapabacteria bacterium]